MIECCEITKRYSSCVAVDNVSIRIEPGKVYAMLGPNGSGKTTLMKMFVGLIKPDRGSIVVDGEPFCDESKNRIVYMPTENYFYPYMKIKDIVAFHKDFYKDFSETVFYDNLNRMGLSFNDKVRNMSTGMLAKLKIAVALARNSEIIMLDEPLNGIDILARDVIIEAIKSNTGNDRSILVSSHLVDELEPIVDGAFFMKNGRVVLSGDRDVLMEQSGKNLVELYKEVYGYGGNGYV